MHRLKAILSPAPVAGLRPRLALLGLGAALAAVAGVSSAAVAGQREPEVAPRPVAAPVSRVLTTLHNPAPETLSRPVVAPVAAPAPAPKTVAVPVAPPTLQPDVISNTSWARIPMPLSYPAAAIEQGLTVGQADLSCSVERDGRVSGCTVISETPEGAGFGTAALQAAADARLSPRSVEGVAVGGTVRFSIRFTMSPE